MIEKADNLTKAQKEELFKRIQQLHKNLIDKRIILVDGIINNPIGKQIEEVIDEYNQQNKIKQTKNKNNLS